MRHLLLCGGSLQRILRPTLSQSFVDRGTEQNAAPPSPHLVSLSHRLRKFTGDFPNDCFAPCFDSTFEVTLLSAGIPIPGGTFLYNAPDDVLAFVGVWTSFACDGVRIIDLTATIDDEYWGEFYTGSRSPVPEPASLFLLNSGILAAGLWRRRAS